MAQSEPKTTEEPRDRGRDGGFVQDLKALPDDIREVGQQVEEGLEQAVERNNRLDYMLDLKTALIAAAVTIVFALILWVIGISVLIGTVLSVAVLAISVVVVAEIRREPAPREPRTSEDSEERGSKEPQSAD